MASDRVRHLTRVSPSFTRLHTAVWLLVPKVQSMSAAQPPLLSCNMQRSWKDLRSPPVAETTASPGVLATHHCMDGVISMLPMLFGEVC